MCLVLLSQKSVYGICNPQTMFGYIAMAYRSPWLCRVHFLLLQTYISLLMSLWALECCLLYYKSRKLCYCLRLNYTNYSYRSILDVHIFPYENVHIGCYVSLTTMGHLSSTLWMFLVCNMCKHYMWGFTSLEGLSLAIPCNTLEVSIYISNIILFWTFVRFHKVRGKTKY